MTSADDSRPTHAASSSSDRRPSTLVTATRLRSRSSALPSTMSRRPSRVPDRPSQDCPLRPTGRMSPLKNAGTVAVQMTTEEPALHMSSSSACRQGRRKGAGSDCASSKTITDFARLCNFRQRDGRFEYRDSKNWTLVVTMIGASQFSVSSRARSPMYSGSRFA